MAFRYPTEVTDCCEEGVSRGDAKLGWTCPGLAVSQLCKRLYYAGHSVALLKTCSKYFQCPASLGLNLEHNHRSVLSKLPIRPCLFPAQTQYRLCLSGGTENKLGGHLVLFLSQAFQLHVEPSKTVTLILLMPLGIV